MTTTSRVTESDNAPGDLTALENDLRTATTAPAQKKAANTQPDGSTTVQKPDWIADKFWNGNLEESMRKQAEAYQPLHSSYGRMANDLGLQRKMTDKLLALDKRSTDLGTNDQPPASKPMKIDARALVDKPTETLDAFVSQKLAEERAKWDREQQQNAYAAQERSFMEKHEDWQTVTGSPDFSTWVHSSPLRIRAAALAAQGNYVIADELLTEYKALQGQAPQGTDPNRGNADIEAARKAGLESSAQAGASGGKGGKIYKRADLIQLKIEKPEVYANPVFQAEILRAYAEGRVK